MSQINTALIADDERPAREKIKRFLLQSYPNIQVLEAQNGIEVLNTLAQKSVDILFLDIQMPLLSGIDVARSLGVEKLPITIFVTAYDAYAVEAFNLEAVDYLLKPFDKARFEKALVRATCRLNASSQLVETVKRVLDSFPQTSPLEHLVVSDRKGSVVISTSDIEYVQAEEKYIHIHLREKKYLVRCSLVSLLKRLNNPQLVQINRSVAVHLGQVSRMEPLGHGDQALFLKGNIQFTVSRKFRNNLPRL